MGDIAKARDSLHALLLLPNACKEARYYATKALSHLEDPQTVTLDRRTPDSPFELPPGRGIDDTYARDGWDFQPLKPDAK